MSVRINLPQDRIADFCPKCGIKELSIFGSTLTENFGHESDVDLLVVLKANTT